MRVMLNAAVVVGASMFLSACQTGGYVPPQPRNIDNSVTVSRPYDEVWDSLVRMAAQTFFAIDNFERSSGLMTLSFGAENASRFIDCGQFTVQGRVNFSGPWVEWVQQSADARLQGRMNLLVQREGARQTRVTANTRYVFTIPASPLGPATIFSFNHNTADTRNISGAVAGSAPQRTCRSTGVAEQEILNAVSR